MLRDREVGALRGARLTEALNIIVDELNSEYQFRTPYTYDRLRKKFEYILVKGKFNQGIIDGELSKYSGKSANVLSFAAEYERIIFAHRYLRDHKRFGPYKESYNATVEDAAHAYTRGTKDDIKLRNLEREKELLELTQSGEITDAVFERYARALKTTKQELLKKFPLLNNQPISVIEMR
ncbi:unnamed protein product [Ambrosiozyma monospora]|uniref:Unnamed protein product n=1 Tax=Ambrosiozyma monospora TaxID=43982 RepID=A0ACB5TX88_AMBMO|nr:unnamed protein product [Ambrosiozyma monospora]